MNSWSLENKIALVTGGSKGIGRATVFELLRLGAIVVFTARSEDGIEELERECRDCGLEVRGVKSDVSQAADRLDLVSYIESEYGRLDILVNNAGINIRKKAREYTAEEYMEILNTNLLAPFELSRELYPLLAKSKAAAIINVSSVAAFFDVKTGTPYGMSKAALLQQTRNLAVEWADAGIRVNAVSPWFTVTPLTKGYLAHEERMEPVLRSTPMGRVAQPEEVSGVIAFLCMEKASYITGQNIMIDGGMSISAF